MVESGTEPSRWAVAPEDRREIAVLLEVNGEEYEYHGDWKGATSFLFALRVYFARPDEPLTVN